MSLLTVRQAAARLGVGYSTFKAWIYQGAVRTTRTRGGHHRVPSAEVDRLLADSGNLPDHRRPPRPTEPPAVVALSTRNQLRGIIEEVRSEGVLAQVKLRVGDNTLTAIITRDAVSSLGLRRGQPAIALIKSTEVMIACEPAPQGQRASRGPTAGRRGRRLRGRPSAGAGR
jgi:molybdopterin-binding protein